MLARHRSILLSFAKNDVEYLTCALILGALTFILAQEQPSPSNPIEKYSYNESFDTIQQRLQKIHAKIDPLRKQANRAYGDAINGDVDESLLAVGDELDNVIDQHIQENDKGNYNDYVPYGAVTGEDELYGTTKAEPAAEKRHLGDAFKNLNSEIRNAANRMPIYNSKGPLRRPIGHSVNGMPFYNSKGPLRHPFRLSSTQGNHPSAVTAAVDKRVNSYKEFNESDKVNDPEKKYNPFANPVLKGLRFINNSIRNIFHPPIESWAYAY